MYIYPDGWLRRVRHKDKNGPPKMYSQDEVEEELKGIVDYVQSFPAMTVMETAKALILFTNSIVNKPEIV